MGPVCVRLEFTALLHNILVSIAEVQDWETVENLTASAAQTLVERLGTGGALKWGVLTLKDLFMKLTLPLQQRLPGVRLRSERPGDGVMAKSPTCQPLMGASSIAC